MPPQSPGNGARQVKYGCLTVRKCCYAALFSPHLGGPGAIPRSAFILTRADSRYRAHVDPDDLTAAVAGMLRPFSGGVTVRATPCGFTPKGDAMTVTQRRILIFFLVTYALSWFGWLGNWLLPSDNWPQQNPLGPVAAALIVIWLTEGSAGLAAWWRRLLRFRAPVWIYAIAFAVPLAVILASIWLAATSGAPTRPLPEREVLEFIILVPIMLLLGPLPEEVSFRGYGQHELQKEITPLSAAIWIGIGVLVWHVPLFLAGDVPWPFILTIVAVSVVYAWLYQLSGSVWPLVLLHFVVNYFGGEWLGETIADDGQVTYSLYFMAFYVIWAALIIWRYGPELGRTSQPT